MVRLSLSTVGLCLVLIGCASPEAGPQPAPLARLILGKWKVDPIAVASVKDPQQSQVAENFASSFKYEFKDDLTFTGVQSQGTYKMTGDAVTVKTTKAMGLAIPESSQPMTGQLSADGARLTLFPPDSPLL